MRGPTLEESGAEATVARPSAARPPVGETTLMRMASFYLARHSASTARLRQVLARKIGRRYRNAGLEPPDRGATAAMIEPVVTRLVAAGLLDDAAVAAGRAAALAARGRPAWRIRAELGRQGLDPDAASTLELDPLEQARILVRRRGFGPYRRSARAERRDRDVAALVRAGFAMSVARAAVDGEAE